MSLSDCAHCWETPCCCGYSYKDWSKQRLEEQIEMLKSVLAGTNVYCNKKAQNG